MVAEDTENVNATTDQKIHTLQETEEEAERDPILVDLTAQIEEEEEEVEAEKALYHQEESTLQEVALISQEEVGEATVDKKEK